MPGINPKRNKLKVFISYSRKDIAIADRLEAALKVDGIETLIDRSEIYAFEDWWKRIQALIGQADTVIFILSPEAVGSEVCQKEVAYAASLNKRFAPIVFRRVEVKTVPKELSQLNFIFFDDEAKFGESFTRLTEALSTNIDWVRRHTEFGASSRNWIAARRPKGLLLRSPLLEQAEQWISSRPGGAPEPTPETREFVLSSRRAATQRRNTVTGSLAAGLVLALGLAGLAYFQRDQAIRARNEALLIQSKYLADQSAEQTANSEPVIGLLLALEALPDASSDDESRRTRPYWGTAEVRLEGARRQLREKAVLKGHAGWVTSVAVSPDGSRVISTSYDRTARVWDVRTLAELATLKGHTNHVWGTAMSPDGARIVTCSLGEPARVWDATTFVELGQLKGPGGACRSGVAFSANSDWIVTDAENNEARIWDARTLTPVATLKGHSASINSVLVMRENQRIVTGSGDGTARVWDAKSFAEIGQLKGHDGAVSRLAITPDGARIITGSSDGTARVWDAKSFAEIGRLKGHAGTVNSVAVTPDGQRIITASDDATARVWDAMTFAELAVLKGHSGPIWGMTVSPDGLHIVTGSHDQTVRLWDARSFAAAGRLEVQEGAAQSVAVSQDGSRIVTASKSGFGPKDNTPQIWDARALIKLGKLEGNTDEVLSVAFSSDGAKIITGSADHTARIWDASSYSELAVLKHTSAVEIVAFNPQTSRFATVSDAVRIWDAKTLAELGQLVGHSSVVRSIAFTPDGNRIVTGSDDNTARVWDTSKFAELAVLKHAHWVMNVAVAADGGRIVTTDVEGTVRVWDATSFANVAEFNTTADLFALTPDGTRLAIPSVENTVVLLDLKTFAKLAEFKGHRGPITSLAVAANGQHIITGSTDGTTRVWELFPFHQALIAEALKVAPRCLTLDERQRYHLSPIIPRWCETMQKWPYDAVTQKLRQEGKPQR